MYMFRESISRRPFKKMSILFKVDNKNKMILKQHKQKTKKKKSEKIRFSKKTKKKLALQPVCPIK